MGACSPFRSVHAWADLAKGPLGASFLKYEVVEKNDKNGIIHKEIKAVTDCIVQVFII